MSRHALGTLAGTIAIGLAVGLAGRSGASPSGDTGEHTLRVFAASSLTESFREIARSFESVHAGLRVELSVAGSAILRAQIEQGAPADVFASADLRQIQHLERTGVVSDPKVLASNGLVVVASTRSKRVRTLADLARDGVTIVLGTKAVPIGRYAEEAIAKMSASGLFGERFRFRVESNVRSRETNVRAVLAKVSLGEADAGIVYRTDARAGREVTILEIPAECSVRADYSIAVVHSAHSPALAQQFVRHVLSESGRSILRKHGFESPLRDERPGETRAAAP